jgi:hypothetical protein
MNAIEIRMTRCVFSGSSFLLLMRGCFEIFSALPLFDQPDGLQIQHARVQRCEMAK